MPFLVRKIELQKWLNAGQVVKMPDVPSDAITGSSLRTSGNALSLWEIKSEADVNDAVLAISSTFDYLNKVDIVKIDPSLITGSGLKLSPNKGETPYSDFEDSHYDIEELSYQKIGIVADIITQSIEQNQGAQFSKNEVKKILLEGIQAKKIDKDSLKKTLVPEIEK
jgi:hypothetical protein